VKTVEFIPWAGASSVLGFGTTSFMAADSTQERLALLAAAYDAGITHFDTAAYYGYGEAERLLGRFLAGKRGKVTITTKFGIEPAGVVKARWINLLARKVLKAAPFLKTILRRGAPQSSSAWGVFDPEKAKASLERSLAALQTDYIDLFLLHEPTLESAASQPLIEFLEGEVARGSIRAYGCGGEWANIEKIATSGLPTSRWLQFENNPIFRHLESAEAVGAKCITFAPFNTALPILAKWLDERPEKQSAWSKELGVDCADSSNLAALLLAGSLARNQRGIVLFSSKNAQRIEHAARVASGDVFSSEQVDKFLELTKDVLTGTQRR
jgi:aryl-alcohol dehydrogenase-like predicted oxidoreductase